MMRFMVMVMLVFILPVHALADGATAEVKPQGEITVMQQFDDQEPIAPERAISDQRKHQILFYMGAALLLLLFATGALGLAMGVWEKDVFVWHMLCAGLTITLAITHAVVSFVWFYPS